MAANDEWERCGDDERASGRRPWGGAPWSPADPPRGGNRDSIARHFVWAAFTPYFGVTFGAPSGLARTEIEPGAGWPGSPVPHPIGTIKAASRTITRPVRLIGEPPPDTEIGATRPECTDTI